MATTINGQAKKGHRIPGYDLVEGRNSILGFEQEGIAALSPLNPSLEELYIDIPVSDGWLSKCKVVQPKATSSDNSTKNRRPLIVYFYGGGYCMGSIEQVTRPARDWAEEHNATVVCPSYRPPPESPFPKSLTDGWDVVSYLSRHAETEQRFNNVRLSDGFVVGGASAGGGIAGVVSGISLLTQYDAAYTLDPPAEKLPIPPTGIFICVGLMAHEDMIPLAYRQYFTAWEDNAHDPSMNTANIMRTFYELQCPDYKSPWFSSINVLERALPDPSQPTSVSPPLKIPNHPVVYLQACQHDPVRDDTLVYARILKDLGWGDRVKTDVMPLDGHTAWTTLPFPESKSQNPNTKEATLQGMKWLLDKIHGLS